MTPKKQAQAAFKSLIKRAGSESELARQLSISRAAVNLWFREGVVPTKRLPAVQRVFGLEPHQVRPDLFMPPKAHE